jgi:hypothetical protein
MNSGVPFGLICCAMMWSSDVPTGLACAFVARLKLKGSLLLGVTGWHVKNDPATFRWGSFPCPRPPLPRLLEVHSFIARIPRGMSSFETNGASGARFVAMRSLAASAPCDFVGKNLVVTQP